jgi:hypothetical protein
VREQTHVPAREVSAMAVNPVGGSAPVSGGAAHPPANLARWAVGLAAVVAVVIVVSAMVFAVAYVTGGAAATEDNWVGFLAAYSLLGGLLASLAAFILAVFARAKHDHWALLWLPLVLFPTLFGFVVLGELFWWE